MTSPLPVVQYLVAFQNNALDDPALITTVAAAGTLGANNVWSDITAFVEGHRFHRGFQHEFNRAEAGNMTLDLNNNSGTFSPWNTSSPFFGFLLPLKLVQLRVTWNGVTYKRFTGHVSAWPMIWSDETSGWAQVVVDDAFRFLNLVNLTSAKYAVTILADTPNTWLRFGDQPGSVTLADSSGNGHTATCTGTVNLGIPGALTADANTAADLPQIVGAGVVNVTLGNTVLTTTAFTVEFWIKEGTTADMMVCEATDASFSMEFNTLVGECTFLINGAGGGVNAGATLNDGGWHHCVFTVAADLKTMSVYIDGVLNASVLATGPYAPFGGPVPGLGWDRAAGDFQIDEFAYYTYALTPTQVANHYNVGIAGFVQQQSGARLGAVLDVVSWSAGARSIDTGSTTIQANTQNLSATKSLAHLQLVEQTEVGALFMTGAGVVRWMARQGLLTTSTSNTSQATFGDTVGSEIPFEADPTMGLDDADIWNEATMARTGGVLQTASDATSITAYGRRTQNLSGLLHITDADAFYHSQFVVGRFKQPVFRMQTIKINLLDFLGSTSQVASVLALELLYRVMVNRHGPPGGGTAFQQVALVESIEETVTPEEWSITLALSPTDATSYFLLNDATNGVLNTSQLGW